jgi:chemotaxis signal transduction protein
MTRRPEVISAAELEARAAELAKATPPEIEYREDAGVLIVTIGERVYGIDVGAVREIVAEPQITMVPLAPEFVSGVINLRGEIIAALDLSRVLQSTTSSTSNFAVIVHREDLVAAFIVDRVEEVDFRADRDAVAPIDVGGILNHPQLLPFRAVAR